ncbi:GNAT family N-acetyltransferase [Hyphomonas jannaschiana]|uniref:GNAT family N-acetyltransferase n=1 Tax=Hyphomonas jannaschiana TaxID=86 RepID=UPI0035C76F64
MPDSAWERYSARPVRSLDELQMAAAIRAAVFMSEQACPYEEEYDGNDLCGTHFLLFDGVEPVGTLRVRWFADFAKLERIALLPRERGRMGLRVLLAEMFELVARKGYRRMLGQIQARLWPVWSRTFNCRLLPGRGPFWFSDYEYREIEIFVPEHPEALPMEADPYQIIRPEGAWDRPGVLDASAQRAPGQDEAA